MSFNYHKKGSGTMRLDNLYVAALAKEQTFNIKSEMRISMPRAEFRFLEDRHDGFNG